MLSNGSFPQRVHSIVGVTHAHGGKRVAVVTGSPGEQPVSFWMPDTALVLQRHLDGYFDGDRAGVREENGGEGVVGEANELFR